MRLEGRKRTAAELADSLRRTRANMLGTEDEQHYWDCVEAAEELDRLSGRFLEMEGEQFDEFQRELDDPPPPGEELRGLLRKKPLWET